MFLIDCNVKDLLYALGYDNQNQIISCKMSCQQSYSCDDSISLSIMGTSLPEPRAQQGAIVQRHKQEPQIRLIAMSHHRDWESSAACCGKDLNPDALPKGIFRNECDMIAFREKEHRKAERMREQGK